MCSVHVCVCLHVHEGACGGQKRVSQNPLELELQMAVSCRDQNLDPLEEQQVLLTTKPSLQAQLRPF